MNKFKLAARAGVLGVFLGVVGLGVTSAAQDAPEVLTKDVRKHLDKQFPGWTLAEVSACAGAVAQASDPMCESA